MSPEVSPKSSLWNRKRSVNAANVLLLLFFGTLAYFFVMRGMQFFLVPSASMETTLMTGDWVMTLRDKEYARGDIVVLWDDAADEHIVKRIVGIPGDSLSVEGGALLLDGHFASEPYIAEPMQYRVPGPLLIEPGYVFLLGDNRNRSDDSHTNLMSYPIDDIVGRVRYIYYPYDRAGAVASYPLSNYIEP